jgi:hypothetical protein
VKNNFLNEHIEHHITEPTPVVLHDGGVCDRTTIKQVGSAIGRFIFAEWSPSLVVLGHNCRITNSSFLGRLNWKRL